MDKRSVYIETSVVSYLASRPSRDLVVAARQEVTRDWWDRRRGHFDLYVSQFVADEAGDGDRDAAAQRLERLAGIPRLEATLGVKALAQALLREGVVPQKAATDAAHIAVASVHGVDFLLTWNCKHLANAEIMGAVADVVLSMGCVPPIICTPDELMGD